MGHLIESLERMHRPGTHRIEVPGIVHDAPACTECRKAWPCPTIDEIHHHKQREALNNARKRS